MWNPHWTLRDFIFDFDFFFLKILFFYLKVIFWV